MNGPAAMDLLGSPVWIVGPPAILLLALTARLVRDETLLRQGLEARSIGDESLPAIPYRVVASHYHAPLFAIQQM